MRQAVPFGSGATLQLIEDQRLDVDLRGGFQRGLPDDACARPEDDRWRAFCADIRSAPLEPARLRLLRKDGTVLGTLTLERPIADLVVMDSLVPGHRWYAVNVDLTSDVGSYSGPVLRLLDSRADTLKWATARNEHDTSEEIDLPTTPKTAWRLSTSARDHARDILLVACRPDFAQPDAKDSAAFLTTYSRFTRVGNAWRKTSRSVPGIWWNEGEFPSTSLFPPS